MNTGQRICVINLIFLVVTTLGVSGEWSKLIYDFMTVFNGDYDNTAQLKGEPEHDFVQARVVPVNTPALPGRPALYVEWSSNGRVILINLMNITESNGVLYLDLYNITDVDQYKPLTFNFNDLSVFKPENLGRSVPACKAAFERDGATSFIGTYGECRHVFNGKNDAYGTQYYCDGLKVMVPVMAIETSTLVPYDVDRYGDKYPLIGAPDGYVNPCS